MSLVFPKGAAGQGDVILIEVAVAHYGPFKFQDNVRPISPLIWVCILEEDTSLKKPFKVIIPHYLVGLSNEQLEHYEVHFAKASHSGFSFDLDGQLSYNFEKCITKAQFISNGNKDYGIPEIDHCCFYCLEANKTLDVSLLAGFCLTRIESSDSAVQKCRVHFIATYLLDTYVKVLL